jgi:hypothetical protein
MRAIDGRFTAQKGRDWDGYPVMTNQLVVRMPTKLRVALEQAAKNDRRSLGSKVRIILEDWLNAQVAG